MVMVMIVAKTTMTMVMIGIVVSVRAGTLYMGKNESLSRYRSRGTRYRPEWRAHRCSPSWINIAVMTAG